MHVRVTHQLVTAKRDPGEREISCDLVAYSTASFGLVDLDKILRAQTI